MLWFVWGVFLFVFLERERGEGQREKNLKQSSRPAQIPDAGLDPTTLRS